MRGANPSRTPSFFVVFRCEVALIRGRFFWLVAGIQAGVDCRLSYLATQIILLVFIVPVYAIYFNATVRELKRTTKRRDQSFKSK